MTILIGLLAGAHTSSWGMYKDAPHEGFTLPKYFRSIIVATLVAIAIDRLTGFGPDTFAHAAVFFGMVYAGERLLVELWKTFIREEDQSKYFIPMQFGVFGVPVKSRGVAHTDARRDCSSTTTRSSNPSSSRASGAIRAPLPNSRAFAAVNNRTGRSVQRPSI